jgi:hypothetical protein
VIGFNGSTMTLDNPPPTQHSDYSIRDGNFVYYEKLWDLAKQ